MWGYPPNLDCSYEYETGCDPETQDIQIFLGKMSVGGGDENCSEDSVQFAGSEGVRDLGDLGDIQARVTTKLSKF